MKNFDEAFQAALKKQREREAPRRKELDKAFKAALKMQKKTSREAISIDWLLVAVCVLLAAVGVFCAGVAWIALGV
jgi:Flp pilus assembly protein TadB